MKYDAVQLRSSAPIVNVIVKLGEISIDFQSIYCGAPDLFLGGPNYCGPPNLFLRAVS